MKDCKSLRGKFKTKKDFIQNVIDREYPSNINQTCYCAGRKDGINEAFESFAERVKFYDRYKNNPLDFHDVLPKTILKAINNNKIDVYNDWLFNYCFKDMI